MAYQPSEQSLHPTWCQHSAASYTYPFFIVKSLKKVDPATTMSNYNVRMLTTNEEIDHLN
jgi:hypothetical protein